MTGRTFPAGMDKKGAKPPVGTKGAADWYWKRYTELYPKYFWADDTKLADIVVASAKGSLLYDVEGKEYIDLTSQWATNNLGNVHPDPEGDRGRARALRFPHPLHESASPDDRRRGAAPLDSPVGQPDPRLPRAVRHRRRGRGRQARDRGERSAADPQLHGTVSRAQHRSDRLWHPRVADATELGGLLRRRRPCAVPDDLSKTEGHDGRSVRRVVPRIPGGPDPPVRGLSGSHRGGDLRAGRPGGGRLDPSEEFRARTSQTRR